MGTVAMVVATSAAAEAVGGGLEVNVEHRTSSGASKVVLEGGAPYEALALRVRGPAGEVLHPLLLDDGGRWERSLGALELDAEVVLEFLRRTPGGRPILVASKKLAPRAPASPRPFQPGAVVVTEVMKDPTTVSDSQGEWIEVLNTSPGYVDLEGWTLADMGTNSHTIDTGGQGLVLGPGQRMVLAVQDDPTLNGGVVVDYRYAGFTLSNGADEVLLVDAQGAVVDLVAYDDGVLWPDSPGVALNLHPGKQTTALNDDPSSWCDASAPIGAGNPDLGTPGTTNTICP
jgi:hypothetical protein